MKKEEVAVNLYSVKDLIKGPESFQEVLRQVSKIGYRAVELYNIPNGIKPNNLKRMCNDAHLEICGLHSLSAIDDYVDIARILNSLETFYVCYPYPEGIDLKNSSELENLINKLNKAGEYLQSVGKILTYHNHQVEFQNFEGKLILEDIFENTKPEYLKFELDVYWIQNGGCSPEKWIDKFAGRLPQIHLKDYTVNKDGFPISCKLGFGNLDMPGIIKKAKFSGCQWFIVEQEDFDLSPIDELAESYQFLSQFFD